MRFFLPAIPAVLLLALFVPSASASADSRVCTGDLIESVQACVGTDGCASVWLGPSERGACVPPVCTTDLVESVSACVDVAARCVTLYLGPSATPVCLDKLAL